VLPPRPLRLCVVSFCRTAYRLNLVHRFSRHEQPQQSPDDRVSVLQAKQRPRLRPPQTRDPCLSRPRDRIKRLALFHLGSTGFSLCSVSGSRGRHRLKPVLQVFPALSFSVCCRSRRLKPVLHGPKTKSPGGSPGLGYTFLRQQVYHTVNSCQGKSSWQPKFFSCTTCLVATTYSLRPPSPC
jgi:hypothetical protein